MSQRNFDLVMAEEGSVLYFFLSYAREDDPVFIRRFFDDLSSQVRDLAGVERNDQVGFLDEQIEGGQLWLTEVNDALASCRCFVALTSPRYFRRDYCGREWYVFDERLKLYEQRWRRRAPALLPVTWIPTEPMHPVAAEIQRFSTDVGGAPYREFGLRQLLDLKRFRHEYRTFVFSLARRIVATAQTHAVPRHRLDEPLRVATNIFAADVNSLVPAPRTAAEDPKRLSRRSVHFVISAGSREEMAARRRKLEYYGRERVDWAPYWPNVEGPIGGLATQIADNRFFDCTVSDISRLGECIAQARAQNEVVVLLVDTWSLDLDEHSRTLIEFDRTGEPNAAVIIPFNGTDAETVAETDRLQSQLAEVLAGRLQRHDVVMYRRNVPNEQFSADLERILEMAQNRIFRKGKVNPKVPRKPSRPRPILGGPTGATDGSSA